jgi:uncharacterized lipoprotein YajG
MNPARDSEKRPELMKRAFFAVVTTVMIAGCMDSGQPKSAPQPDPHTVPTGKINKVHVALIYPE